MSFSACLSQSSLDERKSPSYNWLEWKHKTSKEKLHLTEEFKGNWNSGIDTSRGSNTIIGTKGVSVSLQALPLQLLIYFQAGSLWCLLCSGGLSAATGRLVLKNPSPGFKNGAWESSPTLQSSSSSFLDPDFSFLPFLGGEETFKSMMGVALPHSLWKTKEYFRVRRGRLTPHSCDIVGYSITLWIPSLNLW